MTALRIAFAGWYQARLALDPDPYDDPAGVSGFGFALAWEPPLDRVLRFQEPVAPRSGGPQVGVFVHAVELEGRPAPGHPLNGAAVDLLGRPVFEGRNGLIAEGGFEPIDPFDLDIRGGGAQLRRAACSELGARFGAGMEDGEPVYAEVRAAIGLPEDEIWLRQRTAVIESELAGATDPARRTGLELRLAMLNVFGAPYCGRVRYGFALDGPVTAEGVEALDAPWPVRFWSGGWDNDALCAFVAGELEVPLA